MASFFLEAKANKYFMPLRIPKTISIAMVGRSITMKKRIEKRSKELILKIK